MNDFSFSAVFRSAFNALIKNFTDIFLLSVLSTTAVLVVSLFLNSVFFSRVSAMINAAIAGNAAQTAADYARLINPFVLLSVYAGLVLVTAALFLFFMVSALLPLCKGAAMKLRNYIPSARAVSNFLISAFVMFILFEIIIVALPAAVKAASGGEGYTTGVFAVSVVSFALLTALVIFSLKYVLFFFPLLENAGLKDSLRKSKALTNGRRMKIFVLFAVLFLINFIAKYLIFLLLVTVPFSALAVIYAYLELDYKEIPERESAITLKEEEA
jgi:hypothetical protein